MNYAPLHVHSHYSLLDGVATPREYFKRAKELGMESLAITDHGTIAGHREFARLSGEYGIKPILGVEAYVCNDINDQTPSKERLPGDKLYYHMVLLAKNNTGLANLQRLMEIAWTDGFFVKPRIDWAMLEQYNEGIIATSGCLSGPLAKYIEHEDEQAAFEYLHRMQTIFKDGFYAEIMPHNSPEMNTKIAWLADEALVPVIVTPDCHHATPDQRVLNEIMLLLNTHAKPAKGAVYPADITDPVDKLNKIYGADRQMSFNEFDIHLLSADEIRNSMSYMDADMLTRALENTLFIADGIETYDIPAGLELLPVDYKQDPFKRLQKLAFQGLTTLELADDSVYSDRLLEELQVIKDKNFAPYFLIVYNMINWSRRHGIRVGPGRGSAAGSLLCYTLGITQIDPIKHDLLFFRFINPDRNDLPDIDVDIQDNRRDEVKDYLRRKYGDVANITTWLTWADKGVVRDVARAFMIPLADVNTALKNVHTFEQFVSDPDIAWFRSKYPEVLKYARELRGRIRGSGVHAAGVVVCKDKISNYAPIETRYDNRTKKRMVTIGLDKDEAELVGLTKIDVLGLRSLAILQDFVEITGVELETLTTFNDPAIFADIAAGHTKGVFQLDAHAYTKLAMDMQIANFDDLVASNALVRPGAMNTIGKTYIARRLGKSNVTSVHPIYDRITQSTYGLVIYQEQVMQLCTELGGMTVAEADKVRKIIGKKRDRSEFDVWQDKFIKGAQQYIPAAAAAALWHSFEAHADYSFNKSHAVAYSTISYWTAWAKHYYPLEYMYAMIKNERSQEERTELFVEARRLGIDVRLPHVDYSQHSMVIEDTGLRLGLTDIKYVADIAANVILEGAPYGTFKNWEAYSTQHGRQLNSRIRTALDYVGALDFKDVDRPAMQDKLYEYIGVPNFDVVDRWKFDDIADFDESSAYVFNGMVRSIKRGNGWARAEIIDNTGICGLFVDENTELESGNGYVMVVSGNNIIEFASELTALPAVDNWLMKEYNGEGKYIVAMKPRKTKNGKRIINIVYAEHDELRNAMVFDKSYVKGISRLKPGITVDYKIGRLNDGTRYFNF